MTEALEKIRQETLARLQAARDGAELDEINVSILGRNGALTGILRGMGQLSKDERAKLGQAANTVKKELEAELAKRKAVIGEKMQALRFEKEALDVTEPGKPGRALGRLHPMTQTYREIRDALVGMGFTTYEGPEVEYDDYNFTKLNIAENHPSRDRSDTFYVTDDEDILLRTQTSPMQIRAMEAIGQPPIRILAPGRVYRKDEVDATHSPMFHQIEGLVIDKGITMADLKGTLETLIKAMYGQDSVVRFRPHHFPFTEPSCEVDVQCFNCRGKGCSTCKGEGWIELLGAGMVHPKVLAGCDIDPEIYSGFAFGIGLERMAMRRFKISDMRMIFENDIRFLSQF